MRVHGLGILTATWVVCAVGCDEGSPSVGADAGSDAPAVHDTSVADVPASSDGATSCENFSGYFTVEGSCNPPSFRLPTAGCVSQSGCMITLATNEGTFTGPASGASAQVVNVANLGGATVRIECTLTRTAGGLSVRCSGGGGIVTCEGTGTARSIADASRACCDTTASPCASGERCTLVASPVTGMQDVTACIPATGTVAEGSACAYNPETRGRDTCSAGLYCTNVSTLGSGMGVCRRGCSGHNPTCPSGEACLLLSVQDSQGVCLPTCTPWGSDCPSGTRCITGGRAEGVDQNSIRWFCRGEGTTPAGMACPGPRDSCVANHFCTAHGSEVARTCHALCDDAHPCPGGASCIGFSTNAAGNSYGICP